MFKYVYDHDCGLLFLELRRQPTSSIHRETYWVCCHKSCIV